ncbi:Bacterial protein of uncharacterised function (DUF945) [Achromobacter spanius]|uniref:YdgA family protein n=1 Tax=Achromobacter spanius TaxID=217203 RepID=UPI000C2C69F8|nr:DUF945 family protein [Achromobacter spanius]AUA55505.1 hypothetical protein CVS48_05350 [Achromobacter spanius]CAB3664358.1 hypothetical protein LMG5911_03133 [Achromobacter spanius]SPT38371.1 Bacterial protein of uncharacterised function (DUF945) [Achromobacter denitrificans]VEE57010.1 Bacterial protein of uncharacterised function (DUF945) [Achromobacter spanius]
MKKIGIAGVLGLALGATVAGAAWYTGKRAESDLDQTLGQINGALQALGAWGGQAAPVIELMASERGVFSATRRYRLTLAPAAAGTGQAQELKFVETLDHGPFPLQRLKAGRYAPAMVAGRIRLEDSAFVKDWFAAANGKVPVSGEYEIDYRKQYSARFDATVMALQQGTAIIQAWNLTGNVAYSAARQRGVAQWRADKLLVSGHRHPSSSFELIAPSWRQELTRMPAGAFATQQKLSFTTATFTEHGQPLWVAKDTALAVDAARTGRLWAIDANVDIGALKGRETGNETVGLQWAAAVKNWDQHAFKSLIDSSLTLADRAGETEYGAGAQQLMASMALYLQQFLARKPNLSSSLTVRSASNTSALKLDLGLAPADPTQPQLQIPLLGMLKTLDFSMALSKPMLRDVIALRQRPPGVEVPLRIRKTMAAKQVDTIADALREMGLASIDGDAILARVNLADGMVEANGAVMPLDTFLGRLGGMRDLGP